MSLTAESAELPSADAEEIGDIVTALPPELALHVFSSLGAVSPFSLCTASSVCRAWRVLVNDAQIWKSLQQKNFPHAFSAYAVCLPADLQLTEAADAIHPLADLSKLPRAVVEAIPHIQLLRLLTIRDRFFGLLSPRHRLEIRDAVASIGHLPRSTHGDLSAVALLPIPPALAPCPPFSCLAKLNYYTCRKDVSRHLFVTAHEASRYDLVFRFKDPDEMLPIDPDSERLIHARFRADGIYESEWLPGEQLQMRWRFFPPGPAFDVDNYIYSSDSDSDDLFDFDFDPSRPNRSGGTPRARRSKRNLLRSRVPPSLPAINLPNLSTDKPWLKHSRFAVEDYPVLTAERVRLAKRKEVSEANGMVIVEGNYLGWNLENDYVTFETTGRIYFD